MTTRTRQIKAGFRAIDVALAVVTFFFLVVAIRRLFARPDLAPAPLVDSPSVQSIGARPKIKPSGEYDGLRQSKLFGALSSSNVAPTRVVEEKLPETTLDLELLGLVAQDGDEPGFAIIRDKRRRTEDTYMVGDFIVGDAKVEEIRASEVVISRAGKRETLPMVFSGKQPGGRHGFQIARSPVFPSRRPSQSSSDEPIRVINDNLRRINKAKLMEQVSQNLTSLLNQFRTSPNMVDGKPSGISVDQIGSDPITAQAGLKPGDIIKSINGVRVNSIDSILQQSERFQNAPEIRVVIERNGRHRTLVYKIR